MNEEEKKAIEYYQNKEVSFSVDFDTENLLKALGITEEDSFENHQIRFKTLLNLIERLQKENEELRKELNEENKICMILATEKQDYFEKYKYHLQQNESLTRECSNGILIKKIKDKIEYLERETKNQEKDSYWAYYTIGECIGFLKGLQELLESE